jgi:hypothetical protein
MMSSKFYIIFGEWLQDFKLADRKALTEQFPQHEAMIKKFTRMADKELENWGNEDTRLLSLS